MLIESKAIQIKHTLVQCNTDGCENLARFFIDRRTGLDEFEKIYYCFDCLPEKQKKWLKNDSKLSSEQKELFND